MPEYGHYDRVRLGRAKRRYRKRRRGGIGIVYANPRKAERETARRDREARSTDLALKARHAEEERDAIPAVYADPHSPGFDAN